MEEKKNYPKYDVSVSQNVNGRWKTLGSGALWEKTKKDGESEEDFAKRPEFNGKVEIGQGVSMDAVTNRKIVIDGKVFNVSLFDVARRPKK